MSLLNFYCLRHTREAAGCRPNRACCLIVQNGSCSWRPRLSTKPNRRKAVQQSRNAKAGPHFLKIRTEKHLAFRLGIRLAVLREVAHYADLHYNPTQLKEKSEKG